MNLQKDTKKLLSGLESTPKLVSYMNDATMENLQSYLMAVGGPIVIWPVLLVLHLLSCFCICCCCCCCNKKAPKNKPIIRKVIKLVLAVFCFGLIVISIVGISIAPRFSASLTKVECSLF